MFGKGRRDTEEKAVTILIVEDDALIAFDNEYALREAGFTIAATVDNAADALRIIAGGGLDLVVSDIRLRGEGSGIDVARAAHGAGISLLFVSGHCPAEAKAMAVGCLAKPYLPHDLLAAIQVVVARLTGRPPERVPRALTLFGE